MSLKLNERFQETFISCVKDIDKNEVIKSDEPLEKEETKKEGKKPKKKKLEEHAREKWSNILLYVVNKSGTKEPAIQQLLEKAQLVNNEGITNQGFQFLLKDTKTQMWIVLQEYINGCEARKMKKSEVLQFLFELSFMEEGHEYSTQTRGLSVSRQQTEEAILIDLSEFGIIMRKKKKDVVKFYPTDFAIGLIDNENSVIDWTIKDQGNLIVETNFKLYSYTDSLLQISILNLFCKLKIRTPNLVVGIINRDSLKVAFSKGVTSEQIIDYLYKHAHVQMRKKTPVIPETVSDQIKFWEKEKNRIQYEQGVLWDNFPSLDVFRKVEEESKRLEICLFSDQKSRVLVVSPNGNDVIKEYIKSISK